jgi:hypothetical protein
MQQPLPFASASLPWACSTALTVPAASKAAKAAAIKVWIDIRISFSFAHRCAVRANRFG